MALFTSVIFRLCYLFTNRFVINCTEAQYRHGNRPEKTSAYSDKRTSSDIYKGGNSRIWTTI